jgi:hypothetical protein
VNIFTSFSFVGDYIILKERERDQITYFNAGRVIKTIRLNKEETSLPILDHFTLLCEIALVLFSNI